MNELYRTLLALPAQDSSTAFELDVLHYVVITVSLLGAIAVAAATAMYLYKYRMRRGGPKRHQPHVAFRTELGAVLGLLALFIAFWVVGFRQFVELRTTPANAMRIYVVGKQWMWEFAYPGGAATVNDVYVPVGRPVELVMTSRDVIHSFFVPDFRVKFDVVPGRMTTLWFTATTPGPHEILCAEYCGLSHSRMRGRVFALTADEWAAWTERNQTGGTLARAGERVAAEHGCLRCHSVDGSPHLGPTWAGLYGAEIKLADGGTLIADDAYLTESIMDPERRMHAGFLPIMPSYRGLMAGPELGEIVEYIRSLAAVPVTRAVSPPPLGPLPPIPLSTEGNRSTP